MANLTDTIRWVQYVPDLLGNREFERPFFLELNGSMSKEQMRTLEAAMTKPASGDLPQADGTPESAAAREQAVRAELLDRYVAALDGYVRFGDEPLAVGGKAIATLREYLDFTLANLSGVAAFLEVGRALVQANTLTGSSSFFSGRLSGGFDFTTLKSAGQGRSRAAAR